MVKKFIKNFLIINTVIILVAGTNLSAFSHEMCENLKDPTPSSYISEAAYELKTKDQVISGPCTVFASIAALECYLVKNNMFEGYLSEKHLLTWMRRGDGNIGWNRTALGKGFDSYEVCAYFMSGEGPVLERELPYNIDDTVFDESVHNITPKYSVKGIEYFNTEEEMKKAIIKYGAVCGGVKLEEGLHAICFVGWDDDKNAWLVKDSSGDVGGCYWWMPYDYELTFYMMFTDVKKYNKKEKVYQYDKFDTRGRFKLGSKTCTTVANMFDFDGDEILDSVILGISSESSIDYEIYFVTCEQISQDKNYGISLKKGTIEKYDGYISIELDNKINLKKQKGAIVLEVKVKEPDPDFCVFLQRKRESDNLKLPVQENISYFYTVGDDGNYAFYDLSLMNEELHSLSIKAITIKN